MDGIGGVGGALPDLFTFGRYHGTYFHRNRGGGKLTDEESKEFRNTILVVCWNSRLRSVGKIVW